MLALTFNVDGTALAAAMVDGSIKVWATQTGECVHTLSGPFATVTAAGFGADGTLLPLPVWTAACGS